MSRIFSVLAVVSTIFLTAAVVLGLQTGDFNGMAADYRARLQKITQGGSDDEEMSKQINQLSLDLKPIKQKVNYHRLTAIFASLSVIFVNCISVTYFIGTNRWAKEVVEAYKLDASYSERIRKLKKIAFPWSLLSVVMIIVAASLGAAADPGTGRLETAPWVIPHFFMGFATLGIVALSFMNQVGKIKDNTVVTQEIEAEVHRIRRQHGLDVEATG